MLYHDVRTRQSGWNCLSLLKFVINLNSHSISFISCFSGRRNSLLFIAIKNLPGSFFTFPCPLLGVGGEEILERQIIELDLTEMKLLTNYSHFASDLNLSSLCSCNRTEMFVQSWCLIRFVVIMNSIWMTEWLMWGTDIVSTFYRCLN